MADQRRPRGLLDTSIVIDLEGQAAPGDDDWLLIGEGGGEKGSGQEQKIAHGAPLHDPPRHERPHRGVAQEKFLPGGPFAILPMRDGSNGENHDERDHLRPRCRRCGGCAALPGGDEGKGIEVEEVEGVVRNDPSSATPDQ